MVLARHALLAALLATLLPATALAQRDTSRDALARLEESLALQVERGTLSPHDVLPAMVVSTAPAFEETRAWYPAAALATLVRVFGGSGLRACEACMAPRLEVEDGRMVQNAVAPGVEELTRLDERIRGSSAPARTAIYLDETQDGVSLRIVDLRNGRIVLAENFDPFLAEQTRSRRTFTLTRELERRARGDSLAHSFFDVAVYPGQHISLDFTDQWGDTNANLSGVTFSLFDPVVGMGGAYYRVMPNAMNIMVGGKLIMSLPSALVENLTGEDAEIIDPLLTAVFVVRVPIGSTNYAVTLTASTNGRVGVGLSLLNFTALPFLP